MLLNSWEKILKKEIEKDYFQLIMDRIHESYQRTNVYPPKDEIFRAFQLVTWEDLKVVILGQDPYHGSLEANGLAFSVNDGVKIPPSLRNILKELKNDLNINHSSNLEGWAKQGVLLLNSCLTVEESKPGSHKHIGWNMFVQNVISIINQEKEHIVFVLWGNHAKEFQYLIDKDKHQIITSVHPSPFSARNGFFGSKPFSKINHYLKENNKGIINWEL